MITVDDDASSYVDK